MEMCKEHKHACKHERKSRVKRFRVGMTLAKTLKGTWIQAICKFEFSYVDVCLYVYIEAVNLERSAEKGTYIPFIWHPLHMSMSTLNCFLHIL